MSSVEVGLEKPAVRFAPLFIIAAVLALASLSLNYALAMYIAPLFIPGSSGGNFEFGFELYTFAVAIAFFILSPVVSFLIFYKLGTRIFTKPISDYFRILTSTFTGGLAGSALGYAGFTAFFWATGGFSPFIGPGQNWFLSIAQLILGLIHGGIDMAFLAFTGVIIGSLRSSRRKTTMMESSEASI